MSSTRSASRIGKFIHDRVKKSGVLMYLDQEVKCPHCGTEVKWDESKHEDSSVTGDVEVSQDESPKIHIQ